MESKLLFKGFQSPTNTCILHTDSNPIWQWSCLTFVVIAITSKWIDWLIEWLNYISPRVRVKSIIMKRSRDIQSFFKKKDKSQSKPQLLPAAVKKLKVSSLGTTAVVMKSSQLLLHRMVSHALIVWIYHVGSHSSCLSLQLYNFNCLKHHYTRTIV